MLTVQPPCAQWLAIVQQPPQGALLDRTHREWRTATRAELGVATDRPIIATGHQALLWHPGILAKYLAVEAVAAAHDLACANVIVDQHAEGFGDFDVPVRESNGRLGVRRLALCRPSPRAEVPMGRHEAFTPPRPPEPHQLSGALDSVNHGVRRIHDAVYAHRAAPNAAHQMARALTDLMSPWINPMPCVTATDLMRTSLATALMREMVRDPWRCAACYNRAVASVPEAGMTALLIRDDYVELPLWRIRSDGRRMRAYDNDIDTALSASSASSLDLLPRALFMTAIIRLGMCDLFVHGTGGAVYDRAMEQWICDWLGARVSAMATVTADLRLPLLDESQPLNLHDAIQTLRHLHHDPEAGGRSQAPGVMKQQMLKQIGLLPRNSPQRRAAFLAMHERLRELRQEMKDRIREVQELVERARQFTHDQEIARRRDWGFPLYPPELIDHLAQTIRTMCQGR